MDKLLQVGKYFLSVLLFFICFTHFLLGQYITGYVIDKENQTPIKYAKITVLNTVAEVSTDKDGYFKIKGLKAREWYTLSIEHDAFEKIEQEVELLHDEPAELRISLAHKLQDNRIKWAQDASGEDREWFDMPTAVDASEQRVLEQQANLTTIDALDGLSGVWTQRLSPISVSPVIRGLSGSRNLVLLDGIRLNAPIQSTYASSLLPLVDPFSLSKVEAIRTSASSMYGEGAMGGIIRLSTHEPEFISEGVQVHGVWQTNWLSRGMELGGNVRMYISTPHIAIKGNFGYGEFGDIYSAVGAAPLSFTGFQRRFGDLTSSIKLSANQKLTFAYRYSQIDQAHHYEKVAFGGNRSFQSSPLRHELTYARWESYSANRWFRKVQLIGSLQQLIEDRDSYALESDFQLVEQDELNTWGASLKIHSQPFAQWNIVSGVDFYQDLMESQRYKIDILGEIIPDRNTRFPDGAQGRNLSVFSLHTLDILKLHLAFGGRAHLLTTTFNDPQFKEISLSPRAISSNFSALYPLSRHYQMVASFNSGYRMPNFYDLSYIGMFNGGIEVPNEILGPEKSLTTEIGIKAKTNKYMGSIMLYRTRMSDLMRRVASNYQSNPFYMGQNVFMRQNLGEAFVRGVEAELAVPVSQRLLVYGNLNYTYGEEVNTEEPLAYIPPLHGKAGVRYQDKKGFWGKAEWFYAADQQNLGKDDLRSPFISNSESPSWQVMNVFIGYDVGYDFGWCSTSIGVLNALNSAYRPHGSALDGYGRSVRASLRLKF